MKNVWTHSNHEKGMWRAWARLWKAKFGIEVVWGKRASTGFRLHFGDRGSETPVDFHFGIRWLFTIYGNADWPGLGRTCEWIGRGKKRDLSLQFHSGAMWWKLWYDDEGGNNAWHKCDQWRKPKLYPWRWGRRKYRGWMCLRDGNINLNPLTAFWGGRLYHYEDVAIAEDESLFFDEGTYKADLKLQKQTRYRNHGPKWARRYEDCGYVVDVDSYEGIPYRVDDWKGACVYGFAVVIPDSAVDIDLHWIGTAKARIYSRIEDMRKREKWSPK